MGRAGNLFDQALSCADRCLVVPHNLSPMRADEKIVRKDRTDETPDQSHVKEGRGRALQEWPPQPPSPILACVTGLASHANAKPHGIETQGDAPPIARPAIMAVAENRNQEVPRCPPMA